MASTPIKLGSAAGTALIFQTGSKVTTSTAGVQSCSISAIYGDGQNIWSVLPVAGTPFNEIFGNNYLPSDFKVDITGGGFDIDFIEGKAAKVTVNFKRPDPTQPPGPNGQRARKVSVDSSIKYTNLASYSVVTMRAQSDFGEVDDSKLRYGFPNPIVTVTYNQDTRPTIAQVTRTLHIQSDDVRATDFPDAPVISSPVAIPAPNGSTVIYVDGSGDVITQVVSQDSTYKINVLFSPNPLGWKLTGFKWEPHADESFFDASETWEMSYSITGSTFVGITPGLGG